MNLHAAVRGIIPAVNPDVRIIILRSQGYITNPAGQRVPRFLAAQSVMGQVQPVSGGDLKRAEFLNLQGELRAVWLYGDTEGVSRPLKKGGDVLQFPPYPGEKVCNWLVTESVETWAVGWSHVIVTLQVDKAPQ